MIKRQICNSMGRPSLQESHIHYCVELPCEAKIALSWVRSHRTKAKKDQRTNANKKGISSPSFAFGVNGPLQLFNIDSKVSDSVS